MEELVKTMEHVYSWLYANEGKIPGEISKALEVVGDIAIQRYPYLLREVVRERQDIISSDRECASYAAALLSMADAEDLERIEETLKEQYETEMKNMLSNRFMGRTA